MRCQLARTEKSFSSLLRFESGRSEEVFLSSPICLDLRQSGVASRLHPESLRACREIRAPEEDIVATEDRGFASMDRNKQREIASKGGKAAHQKGTAHEWTCEEAREAGRKGGMASHRRKQDQPGKEDLTAGAPEQSSDPVHQERMIGGSSSNDDLIG